MRFSVHIKIKVNSSTMPTFVEVSADNIFLARALAEKLYGKENIINIVPIANR